ncbi:MAG: phosphate ABC transporter permease subunit PstC, partial [Bacteroidota bacterium]
MSNAITSTVKKPAGGNENSVPPAAVSPRYSGTAKKARRSVSNIGDRIFKSTTWFFAFLVFALVFLMAYEMLKGSQLSIEKFGFKFLIGTTWDPVADNYGALPFIFGTVVSSLLALLLALPLSVGVAVFLAELAPRWLER